MAFSLIILGSSSALPTSDRNLTAHLLNVNERFFLIDCGEGTQLQLRKLKVNFNRIDHIFISHLHGDHIFGLPGLISTFNLLGRKKILHLYADEVLEIILNSFLANFINKLSFNLVFHKLKSDSHNLIFENSSITVHSFPLKHKIPTCGFVFREKPHMRKIRKEMIEYYHISIKDILNIKNGEDYVTNDGTCISNSLLTTDPPPAKSYAFCSDTVFYEEVISSIKNIDILYHEATFADEDSDLAKITLHSTASDAAKIAKIANAKKLIIGHFSSRYKDVSHLLEQANKIFPETLLAKDGMKIDF